MAHSEPDELRDSERIKIDTVFGDKDKDDLKNCFFFETSTPGVFNFYKKDGSFPPLASGITSGSSFTFQHDGHNWRIGDLLNPNDFIISNRFAAGTWRNDDQGVPPSEVDGESGTFTAQAGTTIDPEEAAVSANA